MNLREVREKAEFVSAGRFYVEARVGSSNYRNNGYDNPCKVLLDNARHNMPADVLLKEFSSVILATIDPEPDLPITAAWLREEWGIDANGNHEKWVAYSSSLSGTFVFDTGCLRWWHDGHQTACLKTRQQFCDLAHALGIPRRKDGAK